jgi:hypothetical protein
VDLFVSRHVYIDIDRLPEASKGQHCGHKDVPVQCGSRVMNGESELLFPNSGDGIFEEVSVKASAYDAPGHFGLP